MIGTYQLSITQIGWAATVLDNIYATQYCPRYDYVEGKDGEIKLVIRILSHECNRDGMLEAVRKIEDAMKTIGVEKA